MNTEISEQELLKRLSGLPREIKPQNDVWPSILTRLESTDTGAETLRPDVRWKPLAVAAGVMVAFAAGLLLGPRLLEAPASQIDTLAGNQHVGSTSRRAAGLSATLAATEMEYQAAFREFMSVGDSQFILSPGTVDTLLVSWDEMRQSEAAMTVALQGDPESTFLNTRMIELRSRQLQFLKQVAALDHDSRRISI
jgi:hypothetical protein